MTDDRTPLDIVRSALDADDLAAAEAIHGPIEGWTWATAVLVGELLRQRVQAERVNRWGGEGSA